MDSTTQRVFFWLSLLLVGSERAGLQASVSTQALPVSVLEVPVSQKLTVQDIRPLIAENALVDLEPWRSKGPLTMADFKALREQTRALGAPCSLKLILIYHNHLIFPERPDLNATDCPPPCNPQMNTLVEVMNAALKRARAAARSAAATALDFPNVLFVMNVNDNCQQWCSQKRNCSAPLVSLQKVYNDTVKDRDLLVPPLMWVPRTMFLFPWELKENKAVFRGKDHCECYDRKFKPYCPRNWLAYRYMKGLGHPMLDIGLTENGYRVPRYPNGTSMDVNIPEDVPPRARLELADLARFRYSLSIEGITGSSRFGQLMFLNSPILKTRSPFIEWFYRSVKEDVHFFGFWRESVSDIDPLLDNLTAIAKNNPAQLHGMVQAQMEFAQKNLSMRARILFYQEALKEYKALFTDMDPYIEDELMPELVRKGLNLEHLDMKT